jgi:iron complex outermembrane receptor protein
MKRLTFLLLTLISTFSYSQEIDTIKLNEVQIVSVRAEQKTPVTQKNLTKEEIQKNYIGQDMSYILNNTPSINTWSDNGLYNSYTYFRLRGVDQTRINMTLNGVPLNEPEDQGVYFSNYPDFGANLNSVQIQRGVGSSSYGSSSYIGSINFEGPNLRDTMFTNLESGFGSFNSYRLSAAHNTGIRNKIGIYARYSAIGSDGYRYNSFNRSKTFFTSVGYYGDKDVIKFTGFSGESSNGMAYLATNIEDINIDPRTNYLRPDERDRFRQDFTSLQWIRKTGSNSTLNTSLFYNHLDGNYDIFIPDALGDYTLFFRLKSHFTGALTTWNYSKGKLKVNTGLNVNYYERSHMMSIYPNTTEWFYTNKGIRTEISTFTKVHYDINNKLTSYVDVQFRNSNFIYVPDVVYTERLDPISWNFLNPKAGLKYNQNKKMSHYFSVGMSHREPTRNDLFSGYDDVEPINRNEYVGFGVDTIDIRNIKPERVIDFELGTEWKSDRISISTNVYYMDFENEITPIGRLSYIGLPLRKNVESSFRSGIEFDLKYNPIRNLTISQTFNYSYNRIREWATDDDMVFSNVDPLLTPNIITNTSVSYKWNVLTFGLSGRYVGKSYLDNTMNEEFTTPDYFLLDGYIGVDYKRISFRTMVNNITNVRYFTSGYVGFNGVDNTRAFFIGAPRNIYLTLSYKF